MEKKRLQGARGERKPRRGESAFESFGDPGVCARPKASPRGLLCSSARSPDPGPAKSPAGGSVSPDSPRQQRWHRGPPLPPTSATELTRGENKTKNDPPIPPPHIPRLSGSVPPRVRVLGREALVGASLGSWRQAEPRENRPVDSVGFGGRGGAHSLPAAQGPSPSQEVPDCGAGPGG